MNTTYSINSNTDISQSQTSTLRLHTKMTEQRTLSQLGAEQRTLSQLGVGEARTAFNGDQVQESAQNILQNNIQASLHDLNILLQTSRPNKF